MAHVLLIINEPNLVLSLSFLMEQASFQVTSASSGEQALTRLESEPPPDLALLDIALPDMSGFELLEALRDRDQANRLPVIIVTAHGRQADREKGLALGASDYLTKPFNTQTLLTRVHAALAMRYS